MMQRKFLERKIERKDKGNYLDGKNLSAMAPHPLSNPFLSSPKSARIARRSSCWSNFWNKQMGRDDDFCPWFADFPILHPYCRKQLIEKDVLWPSELL